MATDRQVAIRRAKALEELGEQVAVIEEKLDALAETVAKGELALAGRVDVASRLDAIEAAIERLAAALEPVELEALVETEPKPAKGKK